MGLDNLTPDYPTSSTGLKFHKITSLVFSIIEIIAISVSASSGSFLQLSLCITSICFQFTTLCLIAWMLYSSEFKSFKICLYVSPVLLLGTIVTYPILDKWTVAAEGICAEIISHSTNQAAIDNCTLLLSSRKTLGAVLIVEIVLKTLWVLVCYLGYRFKISFDALISEIREKRRQERAEEMRLNRERENRRKERRRMKLKDKVLNRNE